MTNGTGLELKCSDLLKDNSRLYAHKARRKKIALIRIEAVNSPSGDVRLLLGDAKLVAGGQSLSVEAPEVILRKFSEFTWDFLVYLFLDFNPVLAAVDLFFLLSGPLYNRRLKRQLRELTNDERVLPSGERQQFLLAFRGVANPPEQLQLVCRSADGVPQTIVSAISA